MFNLKKISGGVHPETYKLVTSNRPIAQLPLPEILDIPLKQHAGSESIPIVSVGDRVFRNQLIGKPGQGLSASVHAPTSGVIKSIGPTLAPHPSGLKSNAITIEADGEHESNFLDKLEDPFSIAPELLSKRISMGGIVGMGGASFPAEVKLSSARRNNIEVLLVNGGECEPFLTADDVLMQERADQIVRGARLIQYIIQCKEIAIAIEDNKTKAIRAMESACQAYKDIHVVVVPTVYPMGSSKQIVQAVIGKEIPAESRTNDMGVLIHNVGTAYAIDKLLTLNTPLTSRVVTVSGGAIAKPQNVEALIGTPISHLIKHCGGFSEKPERILLGGPMMGQIMPSEHVPLIKGAGGVLALLKHEIPHDDSSPCIRCGRCVDACPMGLVPLEMAKSSKVHDLESAKSYGLKDCILCGSCAYVCPSHIPLVHHFQHAKGELSKQSSQEKRTLYTRELSEARRVRIEKEAAEKAAAKAAKAAAKSKRKKDRSVK